MTNDKNILIHNIYYMLSYAYKALQQRQYEEIKTEVFENIYDLYAAILVKGIQVRLKQGLCREFSERQEILPTVRGKIDITASIKLKMRNIRHLSCCHEELSEDNQINQLYKTTILFLLSSEQVKRRNKDALKQILLFFTNIHTTEVTKINWKKLIVYQNNTVNRMLSAICYLVLNGLLLTTDKGTQRLASFADQQQMSRLFEKFILEYYRYHYPQFSPAAKQISWNIQGFADYLPIMQSDILLCDGNKKLIIDAKYYKRTMQLQFETEKIHSQNLYQIFTYIKNEDKDNTGNVSGMLLYAKTEEILVPHFEYIIAGNQLSVKTIDLNTPFEQLKAQLNQIMDSWNCTSS